MTNSDLPAVVADDGAEPRVTLSLLDVALIKESSINLAFLSSTLSRRAYLLGDIYDADNIIPGIERACELIDQAISELRKVLP